MKKVFLFTLMITPVSIVFGTRPLHRETAQERLQRLTVQRVHQETQTIAPYMIQGNNRVSTHAQPLHTTRLANTGHFFGHFRLEPRHINQHVSPIAFSQNHSSSNNDESSDSFSLNSSSSEDSFLSNSTSCSQRTENRDNNASASTTTRRQDPRMLPFLHDFQLRPLPRTHEDIEVARFLVQIRGIPANLQTTQNQHNQ